jgi:hypothetical protein
MDEGEKNEMAKAGVIASAKTSAAAAKRRRNAGEKAALAGENGEAAAWRRQPWRRKAAAWRYRNGGESSGIGGAVGVNDSLASYGYNRRKQRKQPQNRQRNDVAALAWHPAKMANVKANVVSAGAMAISSAGENQAASLINEEASMAESGNSWSLWRRNRKAKWLWLIYRQCKRNGGVTENEMSKRSNQWRK